NLIVLVPGYAMARECWTEVALAVVRDNPDALVASVDHSGFGDSTFTTDPPAWEHLGYAAVARTVLAWTELAGLDALPTVLVGHSLGGTGLLALSDETLGAHRARVVLTPMLRDLVNTTPPPPPGKLSTRIIALVFAVRIFYALFLTLRMRLHV